MQLFFRKWLDFVFISRVQFNRVRLKLIFFEFEFRFFPGFFAKLLIRGRRELLDLFNDFFRRKLSADSSADSF